MVKHIIDNLLNEELLLINPNRARQFCFRFNFIVTIREFSCNRKIEIKFYSNLTLMLIDRKCTRFATSKDKEKYPKIKLDEQSKERFKLQ